LAPALFCVAIDWILSQVAPQVGITVGDQCFTDLAYADDAVIFLSDEDQAADCFSALSIAAAPFGLTMSWTKTKVQNLGSGLPSSSLNVDGEIVEGVEEFVYFGSKQTSDIGITASSVLTPKSTSTVHLCNPFCFTGQRRGRC